jgi:hypothetical protein
VEKRKVTEGGFYRHFKGKLYQVRCIAKDTETLKEVVVYQAMYPPYGIWTRPLEEFTSLVPEKYKDSNDYPYASQKFRFVEVKIKDGLEEDNKITKNPSLSRTTISKDADNISVSEDIKETSNQKVNIILMDFLDADTYKKKKEIIRKNRKNITEGMIQSMAMSLDLHIEGNDLDSDINYILKYLNVNDKYTGSRLRQ